MILSGLQTDFGLLPKQDVIVVGAGAVGIVVAVQFARMGVRTLLLEAGSRSVDPKSQEIFKNAVSVGREHRGLHEGRYRALGGTTNFWGGQLTKADASVFSNNLGTNLAPGGLSVDGIEKYYKHCYDMLGVNADLQDDEKVKATLGLLSLEDYELEVVLTRWLREKNFAIRFMREMRESALLTVVTDTTVTGLGWRDGRITMLATQVRDGRKCNLSARFYLLANGTIEISRLLLQAARDNPSAPWLNNEWLGCGFSDHLEGRIGTLIPYDAAKFRSKFDNAYLSGMKLQPRFKITEKAQHAHNVSSAAAHFQFVGGYQEHLDNAKIFFRGMARGRLEGDMSSLPANVVSMIKVGAPMVLHYLRSRRILSSGDINVRLMLEQSYTRQSRIELSDDTDQFGMRLPSLNWRIGYDLESRTIHVMSKFMAEYCKRHEIGTFEPAFDVNDAAKDILDEFFDTYHHMGGTRYGASKSDGVVDCNMRVFGTNNLYILGAATLRSVGFANPTFTAIALGLRAVDHVMTMATNSPEPASHTV